MPGGYHTRMPGRSRKSIRWWPAAVILTLYVVAEMWVWLGPGGIRQIRVIHTFIVTFVAALLLLLWFLLFSRAAGRWRLVVLALVVAGLVFLQQSVTIRGVTGDLVPILGWKGGVANTGGAEVELRGDGGKMGVIDYPQFLGPRRDGTLSGVELGRDWASEPPREIWRRTVGEGWSGFAVVGDRAVTQEQHGDEERVVAYELWSGRELWHDAQPGRYETTIGGVGPRATPTVVNDRVYSLGATGILTAHDLETGELVWKHDVIREHGATSPEWGKSCSPLAVDGLVVVSAGGVAGGSLVAYEAEDGELAWKAGSDRSSYSSPLLATLAGRRQILIMNQASLSGHDPASGVELWSYPWPADQPNVAGPLVLSEDLLLASSGYGVGSKVLRLAPVGDRLVPTLVWESPRLKAKFTNPVLYEGYVYGLDDGVMVCLDPETGERCWKRGRYGHGQTLLVEDLILVTTEAGEVVLLEPRGEPGARPLHRLRRQDLESPGTRRPLPAAALRPRGRSFRAADRLTAGIPRSCPVRPVVRRRRRRRTSGQPRNQSPVGPPRCDRHAGWVRGAGQLGSGR